MKRYKIISFLSCLILLLSYSSKAGITDEGKDKVYNEVKQMPEFPGGKEELMKFLNKNIKYPVQAQENKIQGRTVVTFIVEKDGSISNIQVLQSIDKSLDDESIRVIKEMPTWIPGKERGEIVRVSYVLPIVFRLPAATETEIEE